MQTSMKRKKYVRFARDVVGGSLLLGAGSAIGSQMGTAGIPLTTATSTASRFVGPVVAVGMGTMMLKQLSSLKTKRKRK